LIADGVPYDELLAAMTTLEPDETYASHEEVTLSVGLAALVSPERIRLAEASANEVYVARMGALLAEALEHGGREMRPGLTIEDLVWVVEAFAAGMEVRARTHPEVVARRDATGRHAFSRAYAGLFDALTVPRTLERGGLVPEP
jgi:hypothetical protein